MTPSELLPNGKVRCERCLAVVTRRKYCTECGEPIGTNVNKQDELDKFQDLYQWSSAADAMTSQFEGTTLARLQFLHTPSDGTFPRIKPLRVRSDLPVFFAPAEYSALKRLPPGTYDAESLFDSQERSTSVQRKRERTLSTFVYLNCQAVTITLALPDGADVRQVVDQLTDDMNDQARGVMLRSGFRRCLENLNLMSADRFFGGAQVQFKFRIADAEKFLTVTGDDILQQFREEEKEATAAHRRRSQVDHSDEDDGKNRGGVFAGVGRAMKAVGEFFFGKPAGPTARTQVYNLEYKLARFYTRIRMEFRQAVQQAVRNLQATDLMENKDGTRNVVRDDIQRFMSNTLQTYGIELLEVSAFEFLCPELFAQQRARGDLALQARWLEDQRKRVELNMEAAKLQKENERFDAQMEFEDEVTRIEREAEKAELRDQFALEQQRRSRIQEEENTRFRLAQQLLVSRQTNVLAVETAQTEVKVKQLKDAQQLEAETQKTTAQLAAHKQHLEALRADETAEIQARQAALAPMLQNFQLLPVAVQQQLLATLFPDTAEVFKAAQQADGLQKQVELQQSFQQQLQAAQGKGVEETAKLLAVLAQQAGNVLTAAVSQRRELPPKEPKKDTTE